LPAAAFLGLQNRGFQMRFTRWILLTLLGLAATAGTAAAVDHERFIDNRGKDQGIPRHPAFDAREGGETIATAMVIPAVPFSDQGATCDNFNDYDAVCPNEGSTSPDVVYKYTATAETVVTIDLCSSQYDTKVYVFQWPDTYEPIACNDDAGCGYSGWQSRIEAVPMEAGGEYYIVVDGYGADCGEYALEVTLHEPCVVECPPGALHENEPPCGDNYYDMYNGGC
jgi:hypothetical protein